jgi:hypothetical protein
MAPVIGHGTVSGKMVQFKRDNRRGIDHNRKFRIGLSIDRHFHAVTD